MIQEESCQRNGTMTKRKISMNSNETKETKFSEEKKTISWKQKEM